MVFRWFGRKRATAPSPDPVAVSGSFVRMDNRDYVQGVPYAFPKDEKEVNRLDFQHFLLRTLFHTNILAPVQSPQAILDSGCGTGR